MPSFPLLGRSRSWAVPCLFSLLSLFVLSLPCAVQAQGGYPGGGYPGGGYPGGESGGGYPGGGGPPAVAQYVVTYSGGTVTSTGGPYPVIYRSNDYQYDSIDQTYGGGDVAYSPQGSGAGPTVTCSGQITATFTWVPTSANEPPPDSAIVEEDSTAYGSTTPVFGVSCDDGLSDTPVYSNNFGFSSGTTYLMQSNPGASFTVNCSPSSSGSLGGDGSYASASVSYKATASPAVISLTGGIGPSYAKHLLECVLQMSPEPEPYTR